MVKGPYYDNTETFEWKGEDTRMLSRFDPFNELTTLRRAMDDLMERSVVRPFWPEGVQASVPVDIQETEQGYQVWLSVAGYKPEDLEIIVQQNLLTIRGKASQERQEGKQERGNWIRREIRAESFERTISFERPIDPDRITTSFENGMLALTVPAQEGSRPRRIRITGGQRPELEGGMQAQSPGMQGSQQQQPYQTQQEKPYQGQGQQPYQGSSPPRQNQQQPPRPQ